MITARRAAEVAALLREASRAEILPRADFPWDESRREFCLAYAHRRWSTPPSSERIERLFHSAITTHVAVFRDADGREIGLVTLLRDGGTWFYSNAFYDPDQRDVECAATKVIDHPLTVLEVNVPFFVGVRKAGR